MEIGANLEQEIADIEQRLVEKQALLREQQTVGEIETLPSSRETLRAVVGEKIQQAVPGYRAATRSPVPPPTTAPAPADPPSYLSPELRDQVQSLVNLVFSQDLKTALKALAENNNPALIDAFHDVLVDQFYDELVKQGKIKNI